MEFLVNILLPCILYVVAIILLIILIIIGIRFIKILDKVDRVVDDVEDKINSFNGALAVVKTVGDGLSTIGDSLIYSISTAVSKIFGKFKGKYEEDEDYE